ncbi:MAG: hypothetical protein ACR2LN_00115 [Candidatus Levyibacteriota bacterium]
MQKNIRLLQITALFMFAGIIIGFSNTHSSVTVRAQNVGVTPTLYCLAAGCPNGTQIGSPATNITQKVTTAPASSSQSPTIATNPPVASPSQPCNNFSPTTLQSPAQIGGNTGGHNNGGGKNGKGSSGNFGGNGGRGGFLKDIFSFFLLLIELILKSIGAGNLSTPCSPAISTTPALTNTPIPSSVPVSPSIPVTVTTAATLAPSSTTATPSSTTTNTGIGTGGSIFTGGPFGNTCNPGQLYCNGNVITGGTNNTLYNCQPHSAPSVQQVCPGACKVKSSGNDSC